MNISEKSISFGLILGYVVLNSSGALVIKQKINEMGEVRLSSFWFFINYFIELLKSPVVIIGLLFIFLAAFSWMTALSRLDISIAYPVAVGFNFLVVVGFGILFFENRSI